MIGFFLPNFWHVNHKRNNTKALRYFFISGTTFGIWIKKYKIMIALILSASGLILFALFFKTIQFFEKI